MKKYLIILFVLVFDLRLYSTQAQGQVNDSRQKEGNFSRAHLKESQLLLIKQAFLEVKPKTETALHAHEAVQRFIENESKNEILLATRHLFPDRDSYLAALATYAETEKYLAFAVLLHNRPDQERHLEQLRSENVQVRKEFKRMVFFAGSISFIVGVVIGKLSSRKSHF